MSFAKSNIAFQKKLVILSAVLFLVKLVAWIITDSVTIYSDMLESIVNMTSGGLGFYALVLSAKPKDHNHPYGHGKVEFLSSAVEGILICLAAIMVWVEVIAHWNHQNTIISLDLGLLLVLITGLLHWYYGHRAKKQGERTNSVALTASGKHLMSDGYTTFAILVGLICIKVTGWIWLDLVIAMVLSGILIFTGVRILRKSISGIMDEADDRLLDSIISFLQKNRKTNWIDIHNLRVIKYGSVYHLDCHVTVPWYFNVRQAHDETEDLENLLKKEFGKSVEIFIHTDDCYDFSCKICDKEHCSERSSIFEKQLEWNVDRCSKNGRHRLPEA